MNFFSCVELEMSQASKVLKEAGQLNSVNGITGNGKVVVLTGTSAALTLQRNDSGKTFIFDTTTATTVTLPSLSDAGVGWSAKFIVDQVAGSGAHIVSENAASDTDTLHGFVVESEDAGGSADSTQGTGVTQINFVTGAAGNIGDMAEVVSSSDKWFVRAYGQENGGVTLT